MPTDNRFPLDARAGESEVLASPDRGPRRFRWFVAALTVVWAGALTAAIVWTPFPSIWPLVALAVLVIAAEHRFVLFGDETSMSASIVVILCAVTYWQSDAFLVGPMLVASCGGLLVPLLRARSATKVLANSSGMGVAAGFASSVIHLETALPGTHVIKIALALTACVAYWIANNAVVARFLTDYSGDRFWTNFRQLIFSDTGIVLLALLASIVIGELSSSSSASSLELLAAVGFMAIMASSSRREHGRDSSCSTISLTLQDLLAWLSLTGVVLLVVDGSPRLPPLVLGILVLVFLGPIASKKVQGFPFSSTVLSLAVISMVVINSPAMCLAASIGFFGVLLAPKLRVRQRQFAATLALAAAAIAAAGIFNSTNEILRDALLGSTLAVIVICIGSRTLICQVARKNLGPAMLAGLLIPGSDDLIILTAAFALNLTFLTSATAASFVTLSVALFFSAAHLAQVRHTLSDSATRGSSKRSDITPAS